MPSITSQLTIIVSIRTDFISEIASYWIQTFRFYSYISDDFCCNGKILTSDPLATENYRRKYQAINVRTLIFKELDLGNLIRMIADSRLDLVWEKKSIIFIFEKNLISCVNCRLQYPQDSRIL